jgi:V8-like Glu-specific endopeptidase
MSITVRNFGEYKRVTSCAAMFVDKESILDTYDKNYKLLRNTMFGQKYNLLINSSLYSLPSVENWLPTCFAINHNGTPLIITAKHVIDYAKKQTFSSNVKELFTKIRIVFGFDDTNNNHSIHVKEIFEIEDVYNNTYNKDVNPNDIVILTIKNTEILKKRKLVGEIELDTTNIINSEIHTYGYPYGMPMYKSCGYIKAWSTIKSGNYITDLSAFDGHSGAPVFNINNKIIGIIISGANDFEWKKNKSKNQMSSFRVLRYRKFNLEEENGIFVLPINVLKNYLQ